MPQSIRRSQFITTYGPGAIIEGPSGSRIIPRPDIGLFYQQNPSLRPQDFEISDPRMSHALLQNSRIFRLPSNAELGFDDRRPIYRTRMFPEWYICSEHGTLFEIHNGCPLCSSHNRNRWSAVRFVLACPEGHLDDVDWHRAVHISNGGRCPSGNYPDHYRWISRGSSLSDIQIRCPNCNAAVTMGELYGMNWECTGRFPEREPLNSHSSVRRPCHARALITLKQASHLRIPEIVTLFTVPPIYTTLHTHLMKADVLTALRVAKMYGPIQSKDHLENILRNVHSLSEAEINEIISCDWDEIQQAIEDVLNYSIPNNYHDLLLEEFSALWNASINGAPPMTLTRSSSSPVIFEVPASRLQTVSGPSGLHFRVAPVTRLRAVMVLRGYRRIDPAGAVVDVGFHDPSDNTRWYPGTELLGEGIFIRLENNDGFHPDVAGNAWNEWMRCYQNRMTMYDESTGIFRGTTSQDRTREEVHPVFVWWHTLSHLLIRTLAADAGYSAASIRERVYIEVDDNNRARGGIMLYTTQPGEGTMGGLTSLVENFEEFLERALDNVSSCPNDPLCRERRFLCGGVNGSACYACVFVSETSCEHRNLWLDRRILMECPP